MNLKYGENNYNVIKFNQYDKEIPIEFNLINRDGTLYELTNTDVVKIEWVLPGGNVYIQTDTTRNDNTIKALIHREITLNPGEGYYNIAIEREDGYRQATFKSKFKIVSNSIDENTVPEPIALTLFEQVEEAITACDTRVAEINKVVADADLKNYAKTTDVNNSLDKKVDKELKTGSTTAYKVVSDNNYSDADKTIVDNIQNDLEGKMDNTKGKESNKFIELYINEFDASDVGYNSLTNGFIDQWGIANMTLNNESAKEIDVNFIKQFPTKCINVVGSEGATTATTIGQYNVACHTWTTTGFKLKVQDIQGVARSGRVTVVWRALGR